MGRFKGIYQNVNFELILYEIEKTCKKFGLRLIWNVERVSLPEKNAQFLANFMRKREKLRKSSASGQLRGKRYESPVCKEYPGSANFTRKSGKPAKKLGLRPIQEPGRVAS